MSAEPERSTLTPEFTFISTPALHSSSRCCSLRSHSGSLSCWGRGARQSGIANTATMGQKHSKKPHVGDYEGTPGFPRVPSGWWPGYGFLSMVLKNHSVNLRSWAAAVCDSSCSRRLSCRRCCTSACSTALSCFSWERGMETNSHAPARQSLLPAAVWALLSYLRILQICLFISWGQRGSNCLFWLPQKWGWEWVTKNILSCLPTLFPIEAKTAVIWEDDKPVLIIFSLKKGAWEEVLPWIGGQSFHGMPSYCTSQNLQSCWLWVWFSPSLLIWKLSWEGVFP